MATPTDKELQDKIAEGLRRVGLTFPYLTGLISKIQVQIDRRVETMGVFASGRLAVNPEFAAALTPRDLIFVLTHELYHLMLRTHERGEGSNMLDFNYAHDYIINDMLREELQVRTIPANGLDWPGARLLSAEKIMGEMERNPSRRPNQPWSQAGSGAQGQSGDEDAEDGDSEQEGNSGGASGDVLDAARERQMFPETNAREQEARAREVQEQASKAMSMQALMESMRGRGMDSGGGHDTVAALRGLYRPPWELALQRWLDSVSPGDRSYARPSRRGADRKDVVLPGRKREGWTMHIALDTSGSMVSEIPKALGAIADFCESMGVEQVRLIQCDTEVGSDEVLAPAEVAHWQVTGFGGSNLTPAMLRLGEDPEVSAAIVVTDGDIEYPEEPVPYKVLWVLPTWMSAGDFTPRYGTVIAMTSGHATHA